MAAASSPAGCVALAVAALALLFGIGPAWVGWGAFVLRPFGRLRLWFSRLVYGGEACLYIDEHGAAEHFAVPPPRNEGVVRCVCVSDTHLMHRSLRLPPGDVLLHAGDLLQRSRGADWASLARFADFVDWLKGLPFQHKVVVAGNHDAALAELGADEVRKRLPPGVVYLEDSGAEVAGLRIHGSPLSVGKSGNRAFQPQSGYSEDAVAAQIPVDLDILITHGSPSSTFQPKVEAVRPRYHIWGHNHMKYGLKRRPGDGGAVPTATIAVNVSSSDNLNAPSHPPVVIDVPLKGSR